MLEQIKQIFDDAFDVSKDWLKSHAIMAGIVFVLLLIGFLIVNYAVVDFANPVGIFFIALGLALLDFLPIIGLLIPMGIWAACAILAAQNATLGIAVIVICIIVSLVKQLVEPFVVGKSIGISPLEEIISGLAVCVIMGLNPIGLIIGPILYTVAKIAYRRIKGEQNNNS